MTGFVAAMGIIAATVVASFWSSRHQLGVVRWAEHSQAIVAELVELRGSVAGADLCERDYLITAREKYLAAFGDATNRVHRHYASIQSLCADDPDTHRQLGSLQALIDEQTSLWQRSIEGRKADPQLSAARLLNADLEERNDNDLQKILAGLVTEEQARLARRQADRTRSQGRMWLVNNVARVLSILVLSFVFVAFIRENQRRRETEEQLRRAGEELEVRVRARTAELAEKNKELESIVYVVSHDLRSPLVNVVGFSSRLSRAVGKLRALVNGTPEATLPKSALKPSLDETIPESLEFIEAGAAKMDSLLSGFLRFSRLGRVTLNPARLDMNAVLKGALEAMKFQLEQADTTLDVDALPACFADGTHTGQVFSNLLDNALKYRDRWRPLRVTVKGRREGDRVIYSVADTGVGIAVEHQPRVFEIFHRLNPDAAPGEGLGLTIAQRILERQGGRIWVESEPGVGSTFYVALPANGPAA